jgi:diguanylate cyclase (GGDEF)-like protein
VSLHAFATSADLALAISIGALTITALRSGRRPHRVRSWLVFAVASVALLAQTVLQAIGTPELADAAALGRVASLGLFALGFALLYGADRDQLSRIETNADRDPTTGLLNRRAFREAAVLRLARRDPSRGSVLAVLDLDGFKEVNDSRGHPAGDQILELVATAIRTNLRARDVAARYGGDEFVIFLDECGPAEAERILQRMRKIIASVSTATGTPVTASVGIVASAQAADRLDDLIRAADQALIDVKRSGKDQLRVAASAGVVR